jgi:hypothetical protein
MMTENHKDRKAKSSDWLKTKEKKRTKKANMADLEANKNADSWYGSDATNVKEPHWSSNRRPEATKKKKENYTQSKEYIHVQNFKEGKFKESNQAEQIGKKKKIIEYRVYRLGKSR